MGGFGYNVFSKKASFGAGGYLIKYEMKKIYFLYYMLTYIDL